MLRNRIQSKGEFVVSSNIGRLGLFLKKRWKITGYEKACLIMENAVLRSIISES
jgi:hypothetical protein